MCIRPCSHSGLGRRQKISRDYPALSVPDRKQGLKGNFSGPVRPTRNRRVSISVITIYWLHVRVIYGPSIGGHRARALDGSLRDGISVNVRSTCFFFSSTSNPDTFTDFSFEFFLPPQSWFTRCNNPKGFSRGATWCPSHELNLSGQHELSNKWLGQLYKYFFV